MIQEIEEIKTAERDATLRIDNAKKQAYHLIQKARTDAATLVDKRREEAESEVKKNRENSLHLARTESTRISEKADREIENLVSEGKTRIPDAVDLIVKRVVGGSDVLSGTNG